MIDRSGDMSKNPSGTKTAGKIFAAFSIVLLTAVLAASWFIGGQKRAAQKYFGAVASGSLSDMSKAAAPEYMSGISKDDFKAYCRAAFSSMPEFSELTETDIIGSKVKISECRMNGGLGSWICTADVDYYSSGMSVSYESISFPVNFSGGKWTVDYRFEDLFE